MYIGLHVKYPLFLSEFNENSNFLCRFSKNTQIKKIMKIRPMGTELFHADRRSVGRMDKYDAANSHFSLFRARA